MFYFLNKIDDYIRTNGIPFRNIEIDSSYLPAYFNYAILSKIRNSGTLTFDMFAPSKYTLAYDDNNCLYLEAIGFDGRTRILVYSSNDCRRMVNSSIKGYKVTDGAIYKMTCLVKYTNAIRDIIMNNVKSNYPNETVEYKTKIFYGLMQDIFEKVYKEVGNDIYSLANYSKEINEATDNIIEYINYLNMAYKNDLLEYDKEKLVTVNFVTPDCDTVIRKSSDGNGNNNRERINKIIPANDRVNILNSFDYDYYCLAYSGSNSRIDYYCYLYKNYDDIPILVIESYSGINYTKVIYLERGYNYSKEEFSYLCKKYLELSNFDSFQTGRVIRFNHTNIEDFESNIKLVIDGTSRKKDYNKCMRVKKIVNNL